MRLLSSFTLQRTVWVLACLALGASSMTEAATLTWNGAGANDNWSTSANWGGSTPVAGDVLTFGGMTRLSPVNDLAAGTEISGILFPNNYAVGATGAFSISGASFVLGGNITSTAAAVTGGSFTILDSIANDITLNGTRTITTASTGSGSTQMLHNLAISGVISESGGSFGLTKSGAGTLTLSGLNTFTGPMGINTVSSMVAANTLAPSGSPSSIGAGSLVNLSANTASLSYTGSGNVAFNRQITLTPGGSGGTFANNGTGVITYSGTFGAAANSTTGKTFTLGGSNTGANDFQSVIANAPSGSAPNVAVTKAGDGAWTLSGLNTYLGSTIVNRGTLNVSVLAANGSPSNIGAGTTIAFQNASAVFNYTGSADVTLNRNINLNTGTGGILANLGTGVLTCTGVFTNVETASNKNFTLRGTNTGANTFQSVIADNASGTGNFTTRFTKTGVGTWILTGLNTYTGSTTIEMGRLQVGVAGVGTTGTGAVTLETGATLNGTGIVEGSAFTAQTGTTVHAGDSTAAGTLGTLSFESASGTGNFDFQAGSTVQLDLTASGTSDRLSFTGTGGQTLIFNGNLTVGPATLTPTAARVYQLLSWTGLATTTFASRYDFTGYLDGDGDEPAGLDLPDVAASIYTWDISNLENDGSIALIVRPAPAVNAITHATAAPAVNGFDVANLTPRNGTDKWWVETGTEASTAKGQTFRTGSAPLWLRAITYRIAPSTEADPTKTYVVRVGRVASNTFTLLHSETFTQTVTLTGQRYVTWRFANPVLLTGDVTYGIDVGMTSTTSAWTTGIPYLEYSNASYENGEYYNSGGATAGVGTNTLTYFPTRDRVFHLDIEAPNGATLAFIAGNPADNSTNNLIRTHVIGAFNQNLTKGTSGNIRIRDITNTAAITTVDVPITDPRITLQANNLLIATAGLIEWNKKYAIQIQSGALLGTGGTPFSGWTNDTTWNFNTAAADPLLAAIAALKNHLTGTTVLTAAQISTHSQTLKNEQPRFTESAAIITALFDLITTHEVEVGPLFVVGGNLDRDLETNDIPWTIYRTMEAIMDRIYTPAMLAQYESTLNGYKFATSSRFPGACATPPAGQTNTVSINASFPDTFGRATQMWTNPARKATGSYLAPGTIATVTVPASLVNKGYQIRVGCHSLDNSNRPLVRRIDRCTLAYDITSTVTKVASPLGGGIYIDVPLNANAGVVSITIVGAARSPFFSSLPHRMTTLAEWRNTERTLPGPWADFQTEKVLIQVPRSWIYAYSDPITNMASWDQAVDAMNDLMGFPRIRGKETLYDQVDLQFDSSVYSPGYPTVNNTYSPTTTYNGNHNHYLLTGARNSPAFHFHEPGHAYFFPKHDGEVEASVNLPHVAVMTQKFGVSFDAAHGDSITGFNAFCTLPNTAVIWMTSFNFSPRKNPMADYEKAYQPQGHAKFTDLARLFGWQGINDFFYYYNDREDRGLTSPEDDDSLTLQLCKSYGKDILPMFHFWGMHPVNATTLGNNIAALKLKRPVEIYDRIMEYKAQIPADNAAFRTFMTSWYDGQPSLSGFTVEREHAEQWSTTQGTEYNETVATRIHARVQEILNLYYPAGRPTDYQAWDANFPGIDLPATADADGDGLSNDTERLFGLDPTRSSSNPVSSTDSLKAAGTLTYTRRTPSLSGATYTIWTSTDLATWTQDTGATQTVTSTTADNVQTVNVTLSPALLSSGRRFIRVQAVVP
ncbi:MAG: autotransporter-associated beta strand repeat-containing protein [Verrucomicrobiaceae bacterium]|nr:autotransporter-associated beta strand repeat-containing protein [Verrucomicrobiaceae bacterium]